MSDYSFPLPVLGNSDDVTVGVVQAEISASLAPGELEISITTSETGNNTIDTMLQSGQASWVCRVHSRSTYYRRSFSIEKNQTVQIPLSELGSSVSVETFVVANDELQSYIPTGAHSDYGSSKFLCPVGGLVAIGPRKEFPVLPDFDPLAAAASSFIRIEAGTEKKGDMKVIWDNDQYLLIRLPSDDFERLSGLRQERFAAILHSMIVLPVLTEAIASRLGDSTTWLTKLRNILQARRIDTTSALTAAQTLLSSPISLGLRTIERWAQQ